MSPAPFLVLLSILSFSAGDPGAKQAAAEAYTAAVPEGGCLGEFRRLQPGTTPRFSPDGGTLVYSRGPYGGHQLFLYDLASGKERRLTKDGHDNIDPDFLGGGDEVVFASNRSGTYDIWAVATGAGGESRQLTGLPGDEVRPTASRIPFRLMGLVPESCGGPYSRQVREYIKVLFEHQEDGRRSVRWVASTGGLSGPVRSDCRSPEWSPNGLTALMDCEGRLIQYDGEILSVGDALGEWQRGVDAGEYPPMGSLPDAWTVFDKERKKKDRSARKVPRRFIRYARALYQSDRHGLERPRLSLNGMVILGLAALSGDELPTVKSLDIAGAEKKGSNFGLVVGSPPSWSPRGDLIAFSTIDEGKEWVYVADTCCPLQEAVNLPDFPELWVGGLSSRLVANGFVATKSEEKEFFHIYEKLRYQRRGILVTPDSVLQVFSDVFARTLQRREKEMYDELHKFCLSGYHWSVKRLAERPRDKTLRYLATLFGVPMILLDVGKGDFDAVDELYYDEPEEPEEKPVSFEERVAAKVAALPVSVRKDVATGLAWVKGQTLVEVARGAIGNPSKFVVEFSLTKPRGHYEAPGYSAYFRAMMWLALVPFPLDRTGLKSALALKADGEAWKGYQALDELVGAMAGPPAVPGLLNIVAVAEQSPRLVKKGSRKAVRRAVAKHFGEVKVRTAGAALGSADVLAFPFPQRLEPDVEAIKSLTHPDVPMRGLPSAKDLFVVLGNAVAAKESGPPSGEVWKAGDYRSAVARVAADFAGRTGFWTANVYNLWVETLRLLADGTSIKGEFLPRFLLSDAYAYRLLMSGLAGYTQLKHHLVLYSFQNMGVECDNNEVLALLYEVPVPALPPAYVEPHPKFYRGLAELARRAHQMFGGARETADGDSPEDDAWVEDMRDFVRAAGEPLQSLAATCDRLAVLSVKELEGLPLTAEESRFCRYFGGLLESYTLDFEFKDTSNVVGADQGRMERGVALVTDIYTNLQRGLILHEGVGRPLHIYAEVPHGVARGIVQGGMLSWYEFTRSERMTDSAWWEEVKAGAEPPLPSWSDAFIDRSR